MATKYILLDKKTNKPIDKRPYSIEQLKEKVYAIKKEQNLSDDQMNATFGYLEIDDGTEPAEQNSSGSAQTSENEFKSAESNDDKYGFSTNNYISSANLSDDAAGWNRIIDNVKAPSSIALSDYKKYLELKEGEEGNWAIQKNAIRILYLYNEFLKFYAECTNGKVPASLRGYLKTTNSWFNSTRDEESLDVVKEDMEEIIKYLLDHLKEFSEGTDSANARQEVYDEVEDFDDEIRNVHKLLDSLKDSDFDKDAAATAKYDEVFRRFCGDKKPTGELLSKYLMEKATKKYHLNRIKMDFTKADSTPEWMSPEDQESDNVRLSDDVSDYLDTKNTKIFNADEKSKLEDIISKFKNGQMKQEAAQAEIDKLVTNASATLRKSLELFFDFMGIRKIGVMNNFMRGVHSLNEEEYKTNWTKLVENFKEAMENNIQTYSRAHSNDMAKERRDACVKELQGLIAIADNMAKDIAAANGDKLLQHAKDISTVIGKVQAMTKAAKKEFKPE